MSLTVTKLFGALFVFSLYFALPHGAYAAIAFSNAASTTMSSGTSVSITNFTVGATNPFLEVVVYEWIGETDIVTGVTYNSVAMSKQTNASCIIENGNSPRGYMSVWTLAGQSGTHTITVNASTAFSANSGVAAVGYTGVDQVTPVQASHCTGTAAQQATQSDTVTAGTNNWVISGVASAGGGPLATSPLIRRGTIRAFQAIGDSNTSVTGSYTSSWTFDNGNNAASVNSVAINPAAGASINTFVTQILQMWGWW